MSEVNPTSVAVYCGARTRSGGTCRQRPLAGRTRCRMHGGKTPQGEESPHYKHGRYSRYLPTSLRERTEEMARDPDLLSLRHEIGLIDALTSTTLEGVDVGAAFHAASSIKAAIGGLQQARARGDAQGMLRALGELDSLASTASQAATAIDRAVELVERRRRLVDTERKRLESLQANITVAEAYRMVDAIVQVVREHVSDAATLAAIGRDVELVLGSR